jgi:UDP-N-acetylmuramate: L-alanyl-gamma-D-glutamyl-meso-diaminopimelate ligase
VAGRASDRQRTQWALSGAHNRLNALAALLAARHVGVPFAQGLAALAAFENVKRRMELRGTVRGVEVYDDFAHHPTAIATTSPVCGSKVGGSAHSGRSRTALEHHEAGRDEGSAASAAWRRGSRCSATRPNLGWAPKKRSRRWARKAVVENDLERLVRHDCRRRTPR